MVMTYEEKKTAMEINHLVIGKHEINPRLFMIKLDTTDELKRFFNALKEAIRCLHMEVEEYGGKFTIIANKDDNNQFDGVLTNYKGDIIIGGEGASYIAIDPVMAMAHICIPKSETMCSMGHMSDPIVMIGRIMGQGLIPLPADDDLPVDLWEIRRHMRENNYEYIKFDYINDLPFIKKYPWKENNKK